MSPPDEKTEGGGTPRARLHDISRHFLSDGDTIYRIALCTTPDEAQALPTEGLARALASRGRTVVCIDVAARLVSLTRRDADRSPGPEHLLEAGRLLAPPCTPDIMLVTACAMDEITACDLALFAAPTHTDGLRAAYLRLKTLAQSEHRPRIGITLTGAADHRDAALRFNKLAMAARDFLGIRLASYSWLPADRRRIEASLGDIARLLWEDRPTAQEKQDRRPDREEQSGTHQYAIP